jgi:glycosyltransferase involved in cell wall biosynthesis
MRLLIVSHTPHYRRDGAVVGWGATVREIDELTKLFDTVVHIAPMHDNPAPASTLPYLSPRVRLRPVRPAGGERWRDKVGIPFRFPEYARAILEERKTADVVHVRAPANISLLAMVLLAALGEPKVRWAKYAGDWTGGTVEPWSYRFQRWWLAKGLHRGLVTVNGRWPKQAPHIHSFLNPCLTEEELEEGCEAGKKKELDQPVRMLFVGRLESAKGAHICLQTMAHLKHAGISAELDLIGEGDVSQFEREARGLGVLLRVKFHGGLPRHKLGEFYRQAHLILLPSDSEGWPKVLSEAMAYGVVPIATAVGCIPQYLKAFETGMAIGSRCPHALFRAVEGYLHSPGRWKEHSTYAVKVAQRFSYNHYLNSVGELLGVRITSEPVAA